MPDYSLTPKWKAFVRGKVSSGEYASGDDVVVESLRLLEARERKVAQLRELIGESDADLKAGRFCDFESDAAFMRDIERRAKGMVRSGRRR